MSPTGDAFPRPAGGAVEDIYPLSPLQQGLLYHLLRDPDSADYLSQRSARLHGASLDRVRRAWHLLAERHPVLRTGFLWEGLAEPVQAVYRWATLPIEVRDLRGGPAADRERTVAELLIADRRHGFRPDDVPLARLTLLLLTDVDLQLVWTHHALVTDGWGSSLLLADLHRIEAAQATGAPLPPPPATKFRDYIARIRDRDRTGEAAYWRRVLAGFPAATPLPVANGPGWSGDPGERYCAIHEVRLTAGETRRVWTGARRLRIPFGVVAQAAWALVLSRFASVRDVVFGLAVSGRSVELPDVDRIVGLLTNTVPVRVAVPAGGPVRDWLRRLAGEHAARLAHEHSPLPEVRRHSAVPGGEALFETVLVVQNLPPAGSGEDTGIGYAVTASEGFESTHYPVTLFLVPGERLTVRVVYRRNAVSDRSARLLAECVRTALGGLVAGAGSVDAVPVFPAVAAGGSTPADRPHRPSPGPATAAELLAPVVAEVPDATAVTSGGTTLSYRELDQRSGRLARELVRRGARPERPVVVALERSVDSVVAMLGVWKAGAVYVPVDPSYPATRIAQLVADTGATLAVTTSGGCERLPAAVRDRIELVRLDLLPSGAAGGEPAPVPAGALRPDNLAYLIYTSGSTGSPNGVMVSHRAVLNTIQWLAEALPLGPGEVVAHKNPLGFTDSIFEVLWPLREGAAVSVIDDHTARDPDLLAAALDRDRVTHTQLVPRHLEAIAATPGRAAVDRRLPRLRWVVNTAEPLPASFAARWDEGSQRARIANLYGMTEAAIFSTCHHLPRGEAGRTGVVAIGRPIQNVSVQILNHALEPCPHGVPGDVYVGGAGLARGYLGRPGLTAERFRPDPSGPKGARRYRTGDRARSLPDGTLEYLGRADRQLKVRGFRVEPAEVEEELRGHPAVRDAVVLGHDGRLAGYLVPGESGRQPAGEIRTWLAGRLPDHLVPATLTWIDALPMTGHGKVDRRALPPPVPAREPAPAPVAPCTPLEESLVRIWASVLGTSGVGTGDDFFALGGDSLLAVQVVGRVREEFPVDYTVSSLFQAPTVAGAATVVAGLVAEAGAELEAALSGIDSSPRPAAAGVDGS